MLDVNNVCRICLSEEYPKLPIFKEGDQGSESESTIPEKIMSFAQVTKISSLFCDSVAIPAELLLENLSRLIVTKVGKDDGLPMYICVKCYCQVDTTVEFKKQCEESFNYFQRQHVILSKLRDISSSLQINGENADSQPHILPAHLIKVEESKPEGYLPSQVSKELDCGESLINNTKAESEASRIKCQMLLDHPDMELDLSNVQIKNIKGNWLEEFSSPTEIHSGNFQDANAPIDNSASTSEVDKPCEYRDCKMVASDGREMDFTLGFHESCSSCSKYFQSNKDEEKDICVSPLMETSIDNVDGYCNLYNTSIKGIKSHMDCHSKNEAEVAVMSEEMDGHSKNEAEVVVMSGEMDGGSRNGAEVTVMSGEMDGGSKNGAEVAVRNGEMNMESRGLVMQAIEMTEAQIKCSLCNIVCCDEKYFKVHLKYVHAGRRIIYLCFICKSRKFFNKFNCIKHLLKKHGIIANGNIKYRLVQKKSRKNAKNGQQENLNKNRYIFNPINQYLKQTQDNDSNKEVSELKKFSEKKMGGNPGKCLKQTHPPFCHKPSFVRNNFNLTSTQKGVKHYVCRGCGVTCIGYIAALKHYRIYRKNDYFHWVIRSRVSSLRFSIPLLVSVPVLSFLMIVFVFKTDTS